MSHDRRSVLASIGLVLPFGLDTRFASAAPTGPAPMLRLRPFEEAVREAFQACSQSAPGEEPPCRRIEIGHSDEVLAGVQGCHNDRPFAGYPAGHLRIVRTGTGPGPIVDGVRLYVATVDVILTGGRAGETPGRPLNFATLPAAPIFSAAATTKVTGANSGGRPRSHVAGTPTSRPTGS